jgi:drug/metabolite transporter (DMT)-like permease
MTHHDSATRPTPQVLPAPASGVAWGLLGVAAFSFTIPLTRVAVETLSPLFIGPGRSVVAAVLAATALALTRQRLPRGRQWLRLGVVAAGVATGFPLLTAYALRDTQAGHGAVVIALLPAVTAVVAVLRVGERPGAAFWSAAGAGAVVAVGFAATHSGGPGSLQGADLLLFGAVLAAAAGYAEGGLLSRELGAWQTISWALVMASPLTVALTAWSVEQQAPEGGPAQWAAFAYLGAVSTFLGFFAWYRGLGIGPMATVSQTQLVQPVLSIGWAALLLGEDLTATTVLGGCAVIACAGAAVRVRSRPAPTAVPA